MTRKLRSDAKVNDRHIREVAHAAFAADGLDLAIREIARRADLGVATVYRHFPSREDLIAAVLTDEVTACRAELQQALDDDEPASALQAVIRRFAERQVANRGLNEALLGSHPSGGAFAEERRAHMHALDTLVARAQARGALRDGLTVAEVRIGLNAIASYQTAHPTTDAATILALADLITSGLVRPSGPTMLS